MKYEATKTYYFWAVKKTEVVFLKKKACRICKLFVEGDTCPICKKSSFSTNWQGRIQFLDIKKSMIANEMGVKIKGEYSIKVR